MQKNLDVSLQLKLRRYIGTTPITRYLICLSVCLARPMTPHFLKLNVCEFYLHLVNRCL